MTVARFKSGRCLVYTLEASRLVAVRRGHPESAARLIAKTEISTCPCTAVILTDTTQQLETAIRCLPRLRGQRVVSSD